MDHFLDAGPGRVAEPAVKELAPEFCVPGQDPIPGGLVQVGLGARQGLGAPVTEIIHATSAGGHEFLLGVELVGKPDGSLLLRARYVGAAAQPEAAGTALAEDLRAQGALDLIRALRAD